MDNTNSTTLKALYTIGGVAAILQLIVILVYSVLLGVLGPKPVSAAEYFSIYQSSKVQAFLQGDFLLLVLIHCAMLSVISNLLLCENITCVYSLYVCGSRYLS